MQRQLWPEWLQSDLLPILVVSTFGLCTGYLGCMCLILGSERGSGAEVKEMVGMVTSFSLMVGLSAGSNIGMFLAGFISRTS